MKEEKNLFKIIHTSKGQKLLYERYYAHMYAVALRYLNNKEDAEDTLTEAFIRVFKNLDNFSYRGEGCIGRWIKTIVINESLRTIKNRKRNLTFSEILEDADLEIPKNLALEMDMKYIMKMVNDLPDGYRIVFLMYAVEGYSHFEIANKLDISISTSKTQLFKARRKILEKIKKFEQNETVRIRKQI